MERDSGSRGKQRAAAHSISRPAVGNDNPCAESLFKTLKYWAQLPLKPFADLLQARRWVTELVHWYNEQHRGTVLTAS